jgi:hypothetical protein
LNCQPESGNVDFNFRKKVPEHMSPLKGSVVTRELIQTILERYTLPWEGTHGVPHWARVLENGRRLSETTGARRDIVELFAVFHDSQRINEGIDDGHGRRGAELARGLRGVAYDLGDEAFTLLIQAIFTRKGIWTAMLRSGHAGMRTASILQGWESHRGWKNSVQMGQEIRVCSNGPLSGAKGFLSLSLFQKSGAFS